MLTWSPVKRDKPTNNLTCRKVALLLILCISIFPVGLSSHSWLKCGRWEAIFFLLLGKMTWNDQTSRPIWDNIFIVTPFPLVEIIDENFTLTLENDKAPNSNPTQWDQLPLTWHSYPVSQLSLWSLIFCRGCGLNHPETCCWYHWLKQSWDICSCLIVWS